MATEVVRVVVKAPISNDTRTSRKEWGSAKPAPTGSNLAVGWNALHQFLKDTMRALVIGPKNSHPSNVGWVSGMRAYIGDVINVEPHPEVASWFRGGKGDDKRKHWNWHKDWLKIL